jgi:hypothetical protein
VSDSGVSVESGVVVPREPFSSASGAVAARRKAELAREMRELRRETVMNALAEVAGRAARLNVDLVVDAAEERERAKRVGLPPDKDTMDRGVKAAKLVLDRLAPVVTKVEGEVTHNHLFDALAAVRRGDS